MAQGNGALTVGQIESVTVKRGATFTKRIPLHLRAGYHVNGNAPNEDFLIPLKLSWPTGKIVAEAIEYPKAAQEHYAFSTKPVAVFSGTFFVETRFKVPTTATPGMTTITGKLRYQACNEKECLPPKTVDVPLTLDIQ